MPINQGFSKRLSIAIVKAGKKKGEVARSVGLSPTSLSRYLSGDRIPHQSMVAALAQQLDVTVDYLLGTRQKLAAMADRPVACETEAGYPPDAIALTGLDVEERRTMLRMLDALRSGDAQVRQHLIGQLKIIEFALESRRQQSRAEGEGGT